MRKYEKKDTKKCDTTQKHVNKTYNSDSEEYATKTHNEGDKP